MIPTLADVALLDALAALAARYPKRRSDMADVTSEPAEYPTRPDAEAEQAFAAARAKRVTTVEENEAQAALVRMLLGDNNRMRHAGCALAEAAMHVIREYDGVHRLSLATAGWAEAIANEGGRGRQAAAADG